VVSVGSEKSANSMASNPITNDRLETTAAGRERLFGGESSSSSMSTRAISSVSHDGPGMPSGPGEELIMTDIGIGLVGCGNILSI
jgi:hypothetical protein